MNSNAAMYNKPIVNTDSTKDLGITERIMEKPLYQTGKGRKTLKIRTFEIILKTATCTYQINGAHITLLPYILRVLLFLT